jgi:hypothetical protein
VRFSSLVLGFAAATLASPVTANTPAVPKKLASMDAEAFRSAATIDDDDLEFATIISTRNGFRKERRLNRSTSFDSHVEAHVDKRTGETRFEVHQSLRYRGAQRVYDSVHFTDRHGNLVTQPLNHAQRGADTMCPNSDFNGDCSLTMKLVFSVNETQLRDVMTRTDGWDLKFKGGANGGDDLRIRIVAAEIAGLILAVDEYRARMSTQAGD